jgi:hypothetical protein
MLHATRGVQQGVQGRRSRNTFCLALSIALYWRPSGIHIARHRVRISAAAALPALISFRRLADRGCPFPIISAATTIPFLPLNPFLFALNALLLALGLFALHALALGTDNADHDPRALAPEAARRN